MARVTVAALKMIVRPAVATVVMIAASWSFPLSRSSRNRDTISRPKSIDNPRPNAVATVSACVDTSVNLVMSTSTSSVVTIDVMPTTMGRNAAMRPPKTMTSTASETGNAMLSLTLMSCLTLARISCWTPRVPPARTSTFGVLGRPAIISFAVSAASSAVPLTCTSIRPERPSRLRRSVADSSVNDRVTLAFG
jgi:hypothetical protein